MFVNDTSWPHICIVWSAWVIGHKALPLWYSCFIRRGKIVDTWDSCCTQIEVVVYLWLRRRLCGSWCLSRAMQTAVEPVFSAGNIMAEGSK